MAKIMVERVPARGLHVWMAAALALAVAGTVLGGLALVRQPGISGVAAEAEQIRFLPSTHLRESGAQLPAPEEVRYVALSTDLREGTGFASAPQGGVITPTKAREGMGWATLGELAFSPSTGVREGRGWAPVAEIRVHPSSTFFRESPR